MEKALSPSALDGGNRKLALRIWAVGRSVVEEKVSEVKEGLVMYVVVQGASGGMITLYLKISNTLSIHII